MNTIPCPECGTKCFAEFVDVGVGYQQVGPYHCSKCGWTEGCYYQDQCTGPDCESYSYCSHAKSPMDRVKDDVAKGLFGRKRSTSIKNRVCVTCGRSASQFRDKLSEKEFGISGMCQECQDKVFY